ncbi:hypothetical protein GCK72_010279 [Caenorhabditis remanei]|uniref:CMP/dCMP-type deaminase domain-containing protein n=1 Tax=Caenorhabditis remanei TaxID=31234 RepID=A0A6A5H2U2_CAERE|nr:hypothetical protein GCK72_010279 [Caenorhabditis remanei]KAF1762018.1 hypothetical protein GCK72_010279 [Caenorhabditis remanei]
MTMDAPPSKITKLDCSSVTKLEVHPILDPALTCETIASTSFQALNLVNKQVIGQIIGGLNELPESFQHLKRVEKDGSVLISETEESAKQIIIGLKNDDVRIEDLRTVLVPSKKPSTRRQFEVSKLLWSTAFHPNHDVEKLLDGSFLTDSLREYVIRYTQRVIEMGDGCIAVQSNSVLSSGCPSTHPLGHPVMEMVRNLRKRTGSDYLGTGSDVFLVNEPCAMCSMALVHFRIKRLFYVRNSKNGVLKEDGWQLHLEPSINHHYEVFRVNIHDDSGSNLDNVYSNSLCTLAK